MEQFLGPETDIKYQFLDPETDIKRQFLVDHPETDIMDQFLDSETDIMGERNYILKEEEFITQRQFLSVNVMC